MAPHTLRAPALALPRRFCNTGGTDGAPFTAKEVAVAAGQAHTTTHLSAIWGGNWANTVAF